MKYLDDMQRTETERAIRMHEEEKMTQEIFDRMRDNPNQALNEIHNEVALLNRKVEPLL